MRDKRFSVGLRAALATFAVTLFVMSTHAAAQQETVLYNFGSSAEDGGGPQAGLIFDKAGNLYGTTVNGGANGYGTVFELTPPTTQGQLWTETVLYSFAGPNATPPDGEYPFAGVIFDAAGNLYGTTSGGGASNSGTVFELTPTAVPPWTETALYSFPVNANGRTASPHDGLIFDAAGNLYGTTYGDGLGWGTVFELTPTATPPWTPTVLYDFSGGLDGGNPYAGLIFDAAGNLYGTTFNGGGGTGGGTVFELTPAAPLPWKETPLLQFNKFKDGDEPFAGLIPKLCPHTLEVCELYGTTSDGGSPGVGTVFELIRQSSGSWTEKILHSFTDLGTDGFFPEAGLIFDAAGNLYGTTELGGAYESGYGTVFEVNPASKNETVLYRFGGYSAGDGAYPAGGLIFDAAGNLYGTTQEGGAYGPGTVFEITGSPTSTLVTSSLNPSIYGQSLTFTATVSSSSGTPTGKVKFKNGSATLGTVTLTGGVASFTTTTLGAGTKSITAVYGGNGLLFAGSTSPVLSQVVNKATTTTALASSQNPSGVGQSVTFTASVTPQFSGTPTGSVTFKDGTKTLKTVPLSGGAAGFTTSTLTSGAHTITATYNGSTNFTGSSASLTQTVN